MYKIFSKIRKETKGGSSIFTLIISIGLFVFFMFYPVAMYSYTNKQNLLEDVLGTGLQMVSLQGGLTDGAEGVILENMKAKGLIPENYNSSQISQIQIESNADVRGGKIQNLKYRDSADNKISLTIKYPANNEIFLINALSKIIWAKNMPFSSVNNNIDYYYVHSGVILSEKINY